MQPILQVLPQKEKKFCILYLAKSQLVLLPIAINKADRDRVAHSNCEIRKKKVKKKRMKESLIFLFAIQPV